MVVKKEWLNMRQELSSEDWVSLVIIVVIIIGTFGLLYTDHEVPSWLIGTIGSILTGGIGIRMGGNNNGT